jgi:hypothetical protein
MQRIADEAQRSYSGCRTSEARARGTIRPFEESHASALSSPESATKRTLDSVSSMARRICS